jgi:G3E family GTPase
MSMTYSPSKFGRRVRREGGHRIPVILVTGFLGAGKTTLVKHLLGRPEAANTAVVVNEFGEIGIDDALLRSSTETTVLLDRGCLCCTVRSDLQEALRDLLTDRLKGAVPSFERIVIETSGVADPGPILQTFLGDQGLGKDLYLLTIACVVDAAILSEGRDLPPEAVKQIALSDRIIITKADLVTQEDCAEVERRVREMNPSAAQVFTVNGEIDPAFLLDDTGRQMARTGFFADEVSHLSDINTFSLVFDEELNWNAFARAMDDLRMLRAPDLLRVKGLLAVRGCAGPVVVHYVQHLAHAPMELTDWPGDDRSSRLVFITRSLQKEAVLGLITALQLVAKGGAASEGNPLPVPAPQLSFPSWT